MNKKTSINLIIFKLEREYQNGKLIQRRLSVDWGKPLLIALMIYSYLHNMHVLSLGLAIIFVGDRIASNLADISDIMEDMKTNKP